MALYSIGCGENVMLKIKDLKLEGKEIEKNSD
jgi:hypothetical protein